MTQYAGLMVPNYYTSGLPDPENWRRCDGSMVSGIDWPDYMRRVGRKHGGQGIDLAALPRADGWVIRLADNPSVAAAKYADQAYANVALPSGQLRFNDAPSPQYTVLPTDTVASLYAIGQRYHPPAPATIASVVYAGTSRVSLTDVTAHPNGYIGVHGTGAPLGAVLFYAYDHAHGNAITSWAVNVQQRPYQITHDPIPPRLPRGQVTFTGKVWPPTTPLTSRVRHPDSSTSDSKAVTPAADGTFSVTHQLDTIGTPFWIGTFPTADNTQIAQSSHFQVVQGVEISAVPDQRIRQGQTQATVNFNGLLRVNPGETFEYSLFTNGTPGAYHPLTIGPVVDGRAWFALSLVLSAASGLQLQVRKANATYASAISNAFKVS